MSQLTAFQSAGIITLVKDVRCLEARSLILEMSTDRMFANTPLRGGP